MPEKQKNYSAIKQWLELSGKMESIFPSLLGEKKIIKNMCKMLFLE